MSTGGRSGQGGREWTRQGQMLGGAGHLLFEGAGMCKTQRYQNHLVI